MDANTWPQLPPVGSQVTTACGSPIKFAPDIPYGSHKGRWIYFCLPVCKEGFDSDPQYSCLALQWALQDSSEQ